MSAIFVIGMYRSGTNFFQQLVDLNFIGNEAAHAKHELTGRVYKHSLHDSWTEKIPDELTPVMTYKLPHMWMDSIKRKSYDLVLYYDVAYESGHTPIKMTYCDPDEDESSGVRFVGSVEKLCELYNRYFTYWLSQKHFDLLMINHRDLALNSDKWLEVLERRYDLKRIHESYVQVPLGKVDGSRPFDENVRKYYEIGESRELNSLQIEVMNKHIDRDIWKILEERTGGFPND